MKVNKTYNESNLDTMSRMPDDYVDLVVTSPPYDDLRSYEGHSQFDFTRTATELFRVLKQGGIVVWVVGDQTVNGSKTLTSFKQGLEFREIGFRMYDLIIYHKLNPMPINVKYTSAHEFMFVLSKKKPKTTNFLTERSIYSGQIVNGRTSRKKSGNLKKGYPSKVKSTKLKTNVWKYAVGGGRSSIDQSIAFEHPAIFPEALALDHILSWSNRGDLVYDPFMGSGTTALMCEKAKRNWIGSEISSKYCEIIERRLSRTTFLDLHY